MTAALVYDDEDDDEPAAPIRTVEEKRRRDHTSAHRLNLGPVYIWPEEARHERWQRRTGAGVGHIPTRRGKGKCRIAGCDKEVEPAPGRGLLSRDCRGWLQRHPGATWEDRSEMLRSKAARISRNRPQKDEEWGNADPTAGPLSPAVLAELNASLGYDGARRYLRDLERLRAGEDLWQFKRGKAPSRPVDWSAAAEKRRETEANWERWAGEPFEALTERAWKPPPEWKRGASGREGAQTGEHDRSACDDFGVPTKVNTHAAEHWFLGLRWFPKTMTVALDGGDKGRFVVTHSADSLKAAEEEAAAELRAEAARSRARRAPDAARRAQRPEHVVIEVVVPGGRVRFKQRKVSV
jgi:hypothetical protein